jgi:hypothetical protein
MLRLAAHAPLRAFRRATPASVPSRVGTDDYAWMPTAETGPNDDGERKRRSTPWRPSPRTTTRCPSSGQMSGSSTRCTSASSRLQTRWTRRGWPSSATTTPTPRQTVVAPTNSRHPDLGSRGRPHPRACRRARQDYPPPDSAVRRSAVLPPPRRRGPTAEVRTARVLPEGRTAARVPAGTVPRPLPRVPRRPPPPKPGRRKQGPPKPGRQKQGRQEQGRLKQGRPLPARRGLLRPPVGAPPPRGRRLAVPAPAPRRRPSRPSPSCCRFAAPRLGPRRTWTKASPSRPPPACARSR